MTWSRVAIGIAVFLTLLSLANRFIVLETTRPVVDPVDYPPGFSVPREQLTTQENRPFMRKGRVMSPDYVRQNTRKWREYKRPIARLPTTLSCLVESERNSATPNLLLFDWQAPRTREGIDVCLFRILSSLDDIEKARTWLEFHGFRSTRIGENVAGATQDAIANGTRTPLPKNHRWRTLYGKMPVEVYDAHRPTVMGLFVDWFMVYSFSAHLYFNKAGEVVSAGISARTK